MTELELYTDCVQKLSNALSARRAHLHSAGLIRRLEFHSAVRTRPAFLQMARELPKLHA
jgi:hypothetical protein